MVIWRRRTMIFFKNYRFFICIVSEIRRIWSVFILFLIEKRFLWNFDTLKPYIKKNQHQQRVFLAWNKASLLKVYILMMSHGWMGSRVQFWKFLLENIYGTLEIKNTSQDRMRTTYIARKKPYYKMYQRVSYHFDTRCFEKILHISKNFIDFSKSCYHNTVFGYVEQY